MPAAAAGSRPIAVSALSAPDVPRAFDPAPPAFLAGAVPVLPAERGSAAHMLLAALPLRADGALPLAQTRDRLVASGRMTESMAGQLPLADIEWFLQTPLGLRLRAAERVYREAPFTVPRPARALRPDLQSDEPILLQGTVDCCFVEDGRMILLDYKTDRPHASRPVEKIAADYSGQILLYADALASLQPLPVTEKYLILLCARAVVPIA